VLAASIIRAITRRLIASLIALMMEAASTSETSVNVYQTTWCYNPEDSHLHTPRHENQKSHIYLISFLYLTTFLKVSACLSLEKA
jgi:hypothetical protein